MYTEMKFISQKFINNKDHINSPKNNKQKKGDELAHEKNFKESLKK